MPNTDELRKYSKFTINFMRQLADNDDILYMQMGVELNREKELNPHYNQIVKELIELSADNTKTRTKLNILILYTDIKDKLNFN